MYGADSDPSMPLPASTTYLAAVLRWLLPLLAATTVIVLAAGVAR